MTIDTSRYGCDPTESEKPCNISSIDAYPYALEEGQPSMLSLSSLNNYMCFMNSSIWGWKIGVYYDILDQVPAERYPACSVLFFHCNIAKRRGVKL